MRQIRVRVVRMCSPSPARMRFSKWTEYGYSVTFSNCQCFCYRFSWYICDETRFNLGALNSAHLPTRVAVVQSYMLCAVTIAMGIGWAGWTKGLWWLPGWRTLVAFLYEGALYSILETIYTAREYLEGWHGSEAISMEPTNQSGVSDLGISLVRNFTYPPSYFPRITRQVWLLSQLSSAIEI